MSDKLKSNLLEVIIKSDSILNEKEEMNILRTSIINNAVNERNASLIHIFSGCGEMI